MPFKSQAQRAYMYANHPQMAKEWEAHTPKGKKLPKHVKKTTQKAAEKSAGLLSFDPYVLTALERMSLWVKTSDDASSCDTLDDHATGVRTATDRGGQVMDDRAATNSAGSETDGAQKQSSCDTVSALERYCALYRGMGT